MSLLNSNVRELSNPVQFLIKLQLFISIYIIYYTKYNIKHGVSSNSRGCYKVFNLKRFRVK